MNWKLKLLTGGLILASVLGYYCATIAYGIISSEVSSWSHNISADCAIVLTGSGGRVQKGIDLLSQKRVRKLIISGVYKHSNYKQIFPQWPFYPEVSTKDIILEKRSLTTYGNARQSQPLAQALQCKDVILVTSNIHMPRAKKIFTKNFPENMPIYPYAIVSSSFRPQFWPLSIEVIKTLFYSLWAY